MEFFEFLELIWGELGIFPSPRAFIYRKKDIYDDSHSFFYVLEPMWGGGGELRIFPGPRDSMKSQSLSEGFYVRRKVYTTTRTSFCSLLRSSNPEPHISSYFLHSLIFLHISHIFLHIFLTFPH